MRHLRTTADERRVVVEHALLLRDGLVWNQAAGKAEAAARFELATAVVGDRDAAHPDRISALRVYFGTWSVLGGAPRLRVGPIAPDETEHTRAVMESVPIVPHYFELLARGDAGMIQLFEPDGYFREPANNYACGRDQLLAHFEHILALGGVGVEHRTATREAERIGLELQTVLWGPKRMPQPQAGFAIYELGTHGLLRAARVYDSVVPPTFD